MTGDFDELDEQVAMLACHLALIVRTIIAVFGVLLCLLFQAIYLWSRLTLHRGPS